MEQVRLCTACPMENWHGTSKTTYRVGGMIWICYSRALERRCLRERRKERWRGSCKFELRVGASSVHLLFSSAAANLRLKIIQERTDLWKVLRTFSNDLGGLRLRAQQAVDFITNPLDDDVTGRNVVYFLRLQKHCSRYKINPMWHHHHQADSW